MLNVCNGGSCTDLAQEENRSGVFKAGSRECFFNFFRRHRYGFGRKENLIHLGGRGVSRRLKVYVLLLYQGKENNVECEPGETHGRLLCGHCW